MSDYKQLLISLDFSKDLCFLQIWARVLASETKKHRQRRKKICAVCVFILVETHGRASLRARLRDYASSFTNSAPRFTASRLAGISL